MGDLPTIAAVPKLTVAEIKAILSANNVPVPSGKKAVVVEALQEWLRAQATEADTVNTENNIDTSVDDSVANETHSDEAVISQREAEHADVAVVADGTSHETHDELDETHTQVQQQHEIEQQHIPHTLIEEQQENANDDADEEPPLGVEVPRQVGDATSVTQEEATEQADTHASTQAQKDAFVAPLPVKHPQSQTHASNPPIKAPAQPNTHTQTTTASTSATSKNSKNKKKKKKLHQRLAEAESELQASKDKVDSWRDTDSTVDGGSNAPDDLSDITIEYVAESVVDEQFNDVFEKFQMQNSSEIEMNKTIDASLGDADEYIAKMKKLQEKLAGQAQAGSDDEAEGQEKMSKKKLKKLNRLTVAELKQLVQRPDLVEVWDVTSIDPKLLIQLKSYRNTVPVPVHWCQKRKYLQNKRGIEKAPFRLPQFIADTGVGEMREALQEKEEAMGMRGKAREKVRPKRGKMEIDYQKLHDAFFRYQTKPKMSIHGDMYYEAKELETDLKDKKPGDISDELREALGMVVDDQSKAEVPVPWLVSMQRYGPPPSYPNLRIRGLNAPIPEGCSFGFHPGGWGKPPVDAEGKPLYGDVFGPQEGEGAGMTHNLDGEVNKTEKWGHIASDSESEDSSDEESDEEEEGEEEISGTRTETGLDTPSGYSTIAGLETPDIIELRKKKIDEQMDNAEAPSLYTVVPEKAASGQGANLMGSAHTYDMSSATSKRKADVLENASGEGVELALDPTQLGDEEAIRAAYEQKLKEQEGDNEDFSDMVAEHAARAAKKRKAAKKDDKKDGKKYKEFKF